ncbi:hypothetical protein ABTY61_33650 [Kitasatospora sp. NPDC096128]|uniref:hypothetical protein n=1 Tax=Kitasatospora sp. NPDC096128 TaxID=3155547 RepID=UPI00332BA09C
MTGDRAAPQGDAMAPVGVIIAGTADTVISCSNVSSATTCCSTGYCPQLDPVVSRLGFSPL